MLLLGAPSHVNGAGPLIDLLHHAARAHSEVELVVVGRDPLNPDGDHVLQTGRRSWASPAACA